MSQISYLPFPEILFFFSLLQELKKYCIGNVVVMVDVNSQGIFEAGDIIKYGYMRIKRPPSSTKVRIKVSEVQRLYL